METELRDASIAIHPLSLIHFQTQTLLPVSATGHHNHPHPTTLSPSPDFQMLGHHQSDSNMHQIFHTAHVPTGCFKFT